MGGVAEKSDPELWDRVKEEVTGSDKGGRKGQWSARKAQLASSEYKKRGGGYKGPKKADNHLSEWTREDLGTKSGRKSGGTGERYLPRKAREELTDEEYARTTAKKRKDTAEGKQFSPQPADVAKKAAGARKTGAGKRRPAAKSTPTRKAAAPRTTGRRAASTARKAPARKPATGKTAARKAPARRTGSRKAAPAKSAARKATAGRGAPAKSAARKPAARKTATKRTTSAVRRGTRAAATRSSKGGSK